MAIQNRRLEETEKKFSKMNSKVNWKGLNPEKGRKEKLKSRMKTNTKFEPWEQS